MNSVSGTASVELILWGTVLLVLLVLALVVVWVVREKTVGDKEAPPDMLANFRELRHRGDINDAEFRTITSVLGARLRQESKKSDQKE